MRTPTVAWSYADLDRRVQALAEQLHDLGVGPGARVAVDLGNQASAVVAVWAVLRTGGALTCLDPGTPFAGWAQRVAHLRPRLVLTRSDRLAEALPPPGPLYLVERSDHGRAQVGTLSLDLETTPRGRTWAPPEDPGRTLAYVVYTSGSAGQPKGVMMSHAAAGAAIDAISGYLKLRRHDVVLDLLPLSFDYGLYQLFLCARVGACLVLEPGAIYPGSVLRTLRDHAVTTLPGVPSFFHHLLQRSGFDAENLPALRRFTNTGANLGKKEVRALRRRFPRADVFLMYGLSECKRVSYLSPKLVDRHPDSVGRPMAGLEVAVVDEAGRPVTPGKVGELVVRGTTLMTGYWRNPEATHRWLRPGPWPGRCLWTGDLFRQDRRGLLHFVGRRDDVFKSRGEKVAPAEVEHCLRDHPQVLDVAVIPQPDPRWDYRIHAFVVMPPGAHLDARQLRLHCAGRLESFKVPHEVHFVGQLPLNSHGKVDRELLGKRLRAGASAASTPEEQR